MRLAVIALVIIVMASAIAMAFNYAHQPSYAAPSHAKRNQDANGNPSSRPLRRTASLQSARTSRPGSGKRPAMARAILSYVVIANRCARIRALTLAAFISCVTYTRSARRARRRRRRSG